MIGCDGKSVMLPGIRALIVGLLFFIHVFTFFQPLSHAQERNSSVRYPSSESRDMQLPPPKGKDRTLSTSSEENTIGIGREPESGDREIRVKAPKKKPEAKPDTNVYPVIVVPDKKY